MPLVPQEQPGPRVLPVLLVPQEQPEPPPQEQLVLLVPQVRVLLVWQGPQEPLRLVPLVLLELLALITVNLGILNLLPFPALDGGKVVFLVIEGVTGHAVPEKLQSVLTLATFGLLFGLMLFATYNDILRLITGTV